MRTWFAVGAQLFFISNQCMPGIVLPCDLRVTNSLIFRLSFAVIVCVCEGALM